MSAAPGTQGEGEKSLRQRHKNWRSAQSLFRIKQWGVSLCLPLTHSVSRNDAMRTCILQICVRLDAAATPAFPPLAAPFVCVLHFGMERDILSQFCDASIHYKTVDTNAMCIVLPLSLSAPLSLSLAFYLCLSDEPDGHSQNLLELSSICLISHLSGTQIRTGGEKEG